MADLAERVSLDRFHQRGENVLAVAGGFLEVGEAFAGSCTRVPTLTPALSRGERENSEVPQALVVGDVVDLLAFLTFGAADEFDLGNDIAAVVFGQEGIHADQRQAAIVFLVLVGHRLILDFAALVHGVHRAEHAAALADGFEFLVDGFLDDIGEFVDDEAALPGVLAEVEAEFLVDDHLDRDRATHAFFCRRGDGFVVGVGVQAVAVVEQCVQRLQRGADVVELDLLCMQ